MWVGRYKAISNTFAWIGKNAEDCIPQLSLPGWEVLAAQAIQLQSSRVFLWTEVSCGCGHSASWQAAHGGSSGPVASWLADGCF